MQDTTGPMAVQRTGLDTGTSLVHCAPGAHDVPARLAVEVSSADAVLTGPGRRRYACHDHVQQLGLVPLALS